MVIRRRYLLVVFIAIAIFLIGAYFFYNSTSLVPSDIKSKLDFPAYLPTQGSTFIVDKSTFKYHQDRDSQSGSETNVLSFIVKSADNQITLTEQDFPTTLPYDSFVGTLNPYDSIGSSIGKVTLTRPKRLNGQQTAVVYFGNTLIFAKPDKDLSNDLWRKFFNSLEVVK